MIRLWERFKAFRRGERMIPGATRGRAFVKKEGAPAVSQAGDIINIPAGAKLELVGIKVIRKDGTEEVIQ